MKLLRHCSQLSVTAHRRLVIIHSRKTGSPVGYRCGIIMAVRRQSISVLESYDMHEPLIDDADSRLSLQFSVSHL